MTRKRKKAFSLVTFLGLIFGGYVAAKAVRGLRTANTANKVMINVVNVGKIKINVPSLTFGIKFAAANPTGSPIVAEFLALEIAIEGVKIVTIAKEKKELADLNLPPYSTKEIWIDNLKINLATIATSISTNVSKIVDAIKNKGLRMTINGYARVNGFNAPISKEVNLIEK